jgi:hypothetical protein
MTEKPEADEPIHISSDRARGASDAEDGTSSNTLVPMLFFGLAIVLIGVLVVVMVVG